MSSHSDFKSAIDEKAKNINGIISALLDGQTDLHPKMAEAMRYTLEAPGKRLRAVMALLCCELVGEKANRNTEIAAAAVEMVHTYSLIHDDLPAMDDDDFRRGRPSCHKQFDEATAILAGDALLTMAFELLAEKVSDPVIAVKLITALAKAAGPAGMIAGQMADLEAEHVQGDLKLLEYIHLHKTAKMFEAACVMGGIAAGASASHLAGLSTYGVKIGLGFQVADDILDVMESSDHLGKTAGKDAEQGKLTYPTVAGLEKSKEWALQFTNEAIGALEPFGQKASVLVQLAQAMCERTK